ncbi:MAG: hypothetical protein ACOH15_11340 [Acetobacterium sp.]
MKHKLSITSQLKSFGIEKSIRSPKKKMKTNLHNLKASIKTPKKQNQNKKTAFEWLLLSNYFLEMNDFGDAVIK